jgi:hypothetical protein
VNRNPLYIGKYILDCYGDYVKMVADAGMVVLYLAIILIAVAAFAAFALGIASLWAWLFMTMWNFCIPAMFGLNQIGFWTSFCFVLLLFFFFGPAVRIKVRR